MLIVDPKTDQSWKTLKPHVHTDEVHAKDRLNPSIETPGTYALAFVLSKLICFFFSSSVAMETKMLAVAVLSE